MLYDPRENVIFRAPIPAEELTFTGERYTTAVQGEIRHEHLHRYFFSLQFCLKKDVLDVACGEGYGSALTASIARSVCGIDIEADAIQHAARNYRKPNLHYLAGRAEQLPLAGNSVDVVVCFETLEHLADHERFLSEIKRVLRPDGLLVISSPDKDVYAGQQGINNPHHIKELNTEEFSLLIQRHFENQSSLSQVSMAGSVILPTPGHGSGVRVQGFKHLSHSLIETSEGLPSATYIVTVASDHKLPEIFAGSFDDRPFQLGLYEELQQRHIRILQRDAEIAVLKAQLTKQVETKPVVEANCEMKPAENSPLAETQHSQPPAERFEAPLDSENPIFESLRAQLIESSEQLEARALRIEILEGERIVLERELERLGVSCSQDAASLASLSATLAELTNQTAASSTRTADLEANDARHQQEITELTQEIQKARASNQALEARRADLRKQSDEQEQYIAALKTAAEKFQKDFERLSVLNAQSQSALQTLESELAAKIRIVESHNALLSSESSNLQLARQELASVYSSRAWAAVQLIRSPVGAVRKRVSFSRVKGKIGLELQLMLARIRQRPSLEVLFDETFYRSQVPGLGSSCLEHYFRIGAQKGLDPSPLFDSSYYLERNPDVSADQTNPLLHYIIHGAREGRNPHPLFDISFIAHKYSGRLQPQLNPLIQFLQDSSAQDFDPSPLFDTSFYLQHNEDVASAGTCAFVHYLTSGWREGRDPHPLFDTSYYLEHNPDVRDANEEPLAHYLQAGGFEQRNPSLLFDSALYLEQNPEVAEARINPLLHFVTEGWRQGKDPHPLFSVAFYLGKYPDVLSGDTDPLTHYLFFGLREVRDTHPLFDTTYYLSQLPSDPSAAGLAPLSHFITFGSQENRNPHRLFDVRFYLERNSDICKSGVNPLVHYLRDGWRESRDPSPLFDTSYYVGQVKADRSANFNPLIHYLRDGFRQKLNPHPLFDTRFYLTENPDVLTSGGDSLLHYLTIGAWEGRNPHPLFDSSYYLRKNVDVLVAATNPLVHYLTFGSDEKRNPHPLFNVFFYLNTNQDVCDVGVEPLLHYVSQGGKEGRDPNALFDSSYYLSQYKNFPDDLANPLMHYLFVGVKERRSPHPLFDVDYVLNMNPDLHQKNMEPLGHYLEHGVEAAGRDPHPLFHNHHYLKCYPDVSAASEVPLVHYCTNGYLEGRMPNPLFDSRYYLESNPDVTGNPLAHFSSIGAREMRCPHPLFDTAFYFKRNPDVLAAGVNPLAHFFWTGWREDRDPHPLFDISFYLRQSPDLMGSGSDPLSHYLAIGGYEGRDPHPNFATYYYLETCPEARASSLTPLVHYWLIGRTSGCRPLPSTASIFFGIGDLNIEYYEDFAIKQPGDNDVDHFPLISVVMPTFNSPVRYLSAAIKSVQNQSYKNWELCICDDGSTSPETLRYIETAALSDRRIRTVRSEQNQGISAATNHALANTKGEFVAFLDHDDEIKADALFEIVAAINNNLDADVFYTDQDYINEDGSLHEKFYKPDWSLELFRGVMYVGHLLVVRRGLALEVGGFDSKFDFVQDFEFMLRLSERTSRIIHIPQVLYHWRRVPGSVALHGDSKPGIEPLQALAVNAHFSRCGFPAIASSNPNLAHRLQIRPLPRISSPTVTILLHGCDDARIINRCLESMLDRTNYSSFEIAILTNSKKTGIDSAFPFKILRPTLGAVLGQIQSRFLVLVRPEIEAFGKDWLSYLLLYAEQADIAWVGPLTQHSSGTTASAGLIVRPDLRVLAAMDGLPPESDGYAGSLSCAREVTAVSDVCVMIETEKLRRLTICEYFDDSFYQVVDLCVQASRQGFRNICNPRSTVQLSGRLDKFEPPASDDWLFQNLWADKGIDQDPFHNRNFRSTNFGQTVSAAR